MFIAALFTLAPIWRQNKCPSTDEWIKKMWYIYTMEYYSAIKNGILPFPAMWMGANNIMISEISQRRMLYVTTCMWKLKKKFLMNVFTKQKKES